MSLVSWGRFSFPYFILKSIAPDTDFSLAVIFTSISWMGEFLPKGLSSKRLLLFALSTGESLLTLWYFVSLPTTSYFSIQLCSRLPLPSTHTRVTMPSDMTLHRHASFVMLLCCLLMDSKVTSLASNTPSVSHLPTVTPGYFIILLGYP